MSPVLPGTPRFVVGAPRVVVGAAKVVFGVPRVVVGTSSYSEGWQECPPGIRYSPEIDASNFTLRILSDTPGGFQ